jgi:carbon monoxide dehydrogenase subunit G
MKITGEATVAAPVERVWWALNDPSVLVRTIPGCLRLEETGPDAYRMTITAGVAAIKGTYDGEVSISDQHEPDRFVLHAAGAGAPGTVSADVVVTLEAQGDGTRLAYDADAIVGGVLGGVGQRMIASVARKTASEFFANVEDVLHGRGARVSSPVGDAAASEPTSICATGAAIWQAPAAARTGPPVALAAGVALGSAASLLGVLLGWVLGRRQR